MRLRWAGLIVVLGWVGVGFGQDAMTPGSAVSNLGHPSVVAMEDAGPSAAHRDARCFAQDDSSEGRDEREGVISPGQAKVLLESVDQIMGFVAADTGLAPVVKVKRRLVTREEVNKYLLKSFEEDESAKRLERSEIVLKKFGLLDRDFDLKPFLLQLLTEQIAGYYDDKTKTVNLLNWVDPEEQKPVLAHELTHAVQDQRVGLEKWSSDGLKGVSRTAAEDAGRLVEDEKETARQAVTEGQAMVVFVDYGLPKGTTLADEPELAAKMKAGAESGEGGAGGDSPVMKRAPLLLQRSLLFPYADGLTFETTLLLKGGKEAAFAGVLARPPSSSFEIMQPDKYLAHAPVPQVRLPDVHAELDKEWEPYDIGVMGELDVEMMGSLFGGKEAGRKLAPQWDGGAYYAAQRRSATAEEKKTPGSLGVFYFSRWKTEAAAREFEQVYGRSVGRKYTGVTEGTGGNGERVFTTGEGPVLMVLRGKDLFIAEGFGLEEARKLGDEIEAAQGTGPVRMAFEPVGERELGLGWVGRFGTMLPRGFAERGQ